MLDFHCSGDPSFHVEIGRHVAAKYISVRFIRDNTCLDPVLGAFDTMNNSLQTGESSVRPWIQFTARDLLVTVSIVGISLALSRVSSVLAVTLCVVALYANHAATRDRSTDRTRLSFLVLLVLIVPLEYACARLSFHTLGEIAEGLYLFAVLLNLVFVFIFAVGCRRLAMVCVILLAAWIVPYQARLGHRWWLIQHECARIIDFVNEAKSETGEIPKNLRDYQFRNRLTRKYIRYGSNRNGASFQVTYHVGTRNTSHWFVDGQGWNYYPD